MSNALNWFEIPVNDFERAVRFYSTVLAAELREETMDNIRMAMLPYSDPGVGGALVAGAPYQASAEGPVLYLNAGDDLSLPLARVVEAGGTVLMPKTFLGDAIGYIAWFSDCEGNRVALHSPH